LDDIDKIKGKVKDDILKRARHVVTENERVLAAKDLLAAGKLSEFGELMYKSHDSLKSDYEVSCPELDMVVDVAKGVNGVFGARMTGGGFGGSAIVLIEKKAQDDFEAKIKEAFEKKELGEPKIFPVSPSDGAKVERLELDIKGEKAG
jgi:galactokinase